MNLFVQQQGGIPDEAPPPFQTQLNEQTTRQWVNASTSHIDQYNEWALQRDTYSQRVRRWRAKECLSK